ncbi:hypothetical protein [Leifsonia poae]|uniref:Uncharacterized protein n=1 Tax=Leifsonia poae TaxID=110933 RepID=A0A9W6HA04_9MICO|nr:hypothetical protein [Leifsonia poae]GLJ76285.1 hypothetical protein GCM10017584_18590 [Leifsonia poae]
MDARIAQLEGGPFDGRTWDLTEYAFQAELTDEDGRTAIYIETDRLTANGLPIWSVDVD